MCNVERIATHPVYDHLIVCYDGTIYRRVASPRVGESLDPVELPRKEEERGVRVSHARNSWVNVASLVAECFLGKPVGKRMRTFFLDGDQRNCAADNLIVLPMSASSPLIQVRDRQLVHLCSVCKEIAAPYGHEGKRQINGVPVCENCFQKRPWASIETVVKGNNKVYRRCTLCGELRLASLFGERGRGTICRHCKEGTGPYEAGRSAEKFGVVPYRRPRVFQAGERKVTAPKAARMETIIRKLESGGFPYTTPGKMEVLEEIAQIVKTVFSRPARFLMMPNFGKEIAVYAKIGGVMDPIHSVLVERDPLIYEELCWFVKHLYRGPKAFKSDVNDFVADDLNVDLLWNVDVAHLDYNYLITRRAVEAIDRLLYIGKLVFVTVQHASRYGGESNARIPLMEFRNGRVIWEREYIGNRHSRMVTYCVAPTHGVFARRVNFVNPIESVACSDQALLKVARDAIGNSASQCLEVAEARRRTMAEAAASASQERWERWKQSLSEYFTLLRQHDARSLMDLEDPPPALVEWEKSVRATRNRQTTYPADCLALLKDNGFEFNPRDEIFRRAKRELLQFKQCLDAPGRYTGLKDMPSYKTRSLFINALNPAMFVNGAELADYARSIGLDVEKPLTDHAFESNIEKLRSIVAGSFKLEQISELHGKSMLARWKRSVINYVAKARYGKVSEGRLSLLRSFPLVEWSERMSSNRQWRSIRIDVI